MKILCISGKNLASLGGDFEVDLASAPLGLVGLFAIVGPTGSGKSTILDAMCLALYGKTPRMGATRDTTRFEVGGRSITAADARQLVRRGAAEASATVRFGVGDERYEATWSVTALRQGPNRGQLGDVKRSVGKEGSTALLATGTNDVNATVGELTGLSFEQFCRCMLLAQGEFAAFLQANSKERTAVLEALTDSRRVYRNLSMLAQKQGAAAQDEVDAAREDIARVVVLAPDALTELEARLTRCVKDADAAKAVLDVTQDALGWWQRADDADTRVRDAHARLGLAEQQFAAAEPQRRRLQASEAVAPLREPLHSLNAATSEAQRFAGELQQLEAQRAQSETLHASRAEALVQAQAAVTAFEVQVARTRPELETARHLDRQRADLGEQHAKDQLTLAELAQEGGELERRATGVMGREQKLLQERTSLDAWFHDNATAGQFFAQRDAWLGPLTRHVKAAGDREGLRGSFEAHRQEATATQVLSVQAHSMLEAARRDRETAQGGIEAAQQQADALRAKVSVEETRKREARLRALDDLQKTGTSLLEQRAVSHARATECAGAKASQGEAQAQLDAAQQSMAEVEATLATVRAREQFATQQAGVEAHRKALQDGEPCLVCGSLEHPWATPGQVLSVAALTTEREAAERRLGECRTARDTHQRAVMQHETRADQLAREQAKALADVDALGAEWTRLATSAAPVPSEPPREVLPAVLATERDAVQGQLATLGKLDAEAKQAAEAVTELRARSKEKELALAAAQQAEEKARQRNTDTQQVVREEQLKLETLEATLRETWAEAAPALGDLASQRPHFEAAPRKTLEAWTALAAAHEAKRSLDVELVTRAATLQVDRAALRRDQDVWSAKNEPIAERHAQRQTQLEALALARRALFGGRDVASVEAEQQAQTTRLAQASADAQQARDVAANTLNALTGRRDERRRQLEHSEAQRALAQAGWHAALAQHQVDETTAHALLAVGEEELKGWRAALEVVRLAREKAGHVHAEAVAARKELEATRPTDDRDVLTARKTAAASAWESLRTELGRLQKEHDDDDAARVERAKKEKALELVLGTAGLASELNALIGHGDGDKFAEFAQALVLDQMLEAANEQLRRLQPRYSLMRLDHGRAEVAGLLEVAIVDRHLGERLRPVSTLSGGERFLVSLALALGLSAMSGEASQLGTMFIDEGFGTLDAETLQVAMGVLDSLQQQGKQVGIISHVGDLADRITAQVRVERVDSGQGLSRVRVVPETKA